MADVEVVWQSRDATAADLVQKCADGLLPFAGPCSLYTEFAARGWSTRYLYEAVMNAKRLR